VATIPLLFELSPLEFAALARLDEFLFAREALLVLVDRVERKRVLEQLVRKPLLCPPLSLPLFP
jgi:hypothetical protein